MYIAIVTIVWLYITIFFGLFATSLLLRMQIYMNLYLNLRCVAQNLENVTKKKIVINKAKFMPIVTYRTTDKHLPELYAFLCRIIN